MSQDAAKRSAKVQARNSRPCKTNAVHFTEAGKLAADLLKSQPDGSKASFSPMAKSALHIGDA
jgi:hypothetical protein